MLVAFAGVAWLISVRQGGVLGEGIN